MEAEYQSPGCNHSLSCLYFELYNTYHQLCILHALLKVTSVAFNNQTPAPETLIWLHREIDYTYIWWRHQIKTFSALLALCAGNSPATGEFPSQRPVTRRFAIFFDLRLNARLSKQSRRPWFETLSRSLWGRCNTSATKLKCNPTNTCKTKSCTYMTEHAVINHACDDLT